MANVVTSRSGTLTYYSSKVNGTAEVSYITYFYDDGTSSIRIYQARQTANTSYGGSSDTDKFYVIFDGTSYNIGALNMVVPARGTSPGYTIDKYFYSLTPGSSHTLCGDDPWNYFYVGNTHSSKTQSITAQAKPTYTVSYAANGGTSTPASQTKTGGTNLTLRGAISHNNTTANGYTITINANGGSSTIASRTAIDTTSYSFYRGKDSGGSYGSAGGSYTTNAGTTMTAQGDTSVTKGTVTLPTAAQCIRTNYTLLGFDSNSNATSPTYTPGQTYTPSSSTTLYAIGEKNQAKIYIKDSNDNGVQGYVYYKDNNNEGVIARRIYIKNNNDTGDEGV